jgi:hypothetical protein
VASKWWARASSFNSIRLFAGIFGNEGQLNYEFAHPAWLLIIKAGLKKLYIIRKVNDE